MPKKLLSDHENCWCVCVCVCCQAAIRKELNEFKSGEMEVHEESKKYTRYMHFIVFTQSMKKMTKKYG